MKVLRAGSSITPQRRLAEVFSHKPSLVSVSDDGRIRHNGTAPGFLYRVVEPLQPADLRPHPWSNMEPGWEFITQRQLALELLAQVEIQPGELLSQAEIEELMSR